MRQLAALVIAVALIAASGCSSEETSSVESPPSATNTASSPPTTLTQARELWADLGPSAYSLNLVSACGERSGLGTYKVTVTPEGTTAEGTTRWSFGTDVQTVPDLFEFIDDADSGGAQVVDVTYNSDLGYPETISVDYMVNAIDDEACYTVKGFVPNEPIE
jgi:hypothetical protein